jgi:hypothetical protein
MVGCIDSTAKMLPGKVDETKLSVMKEITLPNNATIQDDTQVDWTSLCDFEPAQKTVLPLLNVKGESAAAITKFDLIQSNTERRITKKMEGLIQKIQDVMESLEAHYADFEGGVERIMLNNHQRRLDNQKRVEKSAQKAQSLFLGLLNGLQYSK